MMTNSFLELLLIAVWALLAQGLVYCVYSAQREWCLRRALHVRNAPAQLFLDAIFGGIVGWTVAILLIAILGCFMAPLFLVMIVSGLDGWYQLYRQNVRDREMRRQARTIRMLTKLQFGIVDFWTGALCFGVILTLIFNFVLSRHEAENAAAISVYAVASETVAFLIAMDVCRHSPALQRALPRALYTMLVMFAAALPPMIVILIMAWNAWRYALRMSRIQ